MGGTERDVGLSEATEEPATPEAQIARLTRLLAAHDPTLAITGARLLTQGWDSLVLVVNEACIVRFARRPEIATQFVKERANVVALWEDYLADDAHFRFTPALIHRDLAVEHILHDPAHAKLTGVIDWGDTAIGDPALDFTGLLRGAGEAFTERVLAAYALPIDESLRRRARFYAAIVPFHALRFGLETGAAEHVAHGLTLLRQRIHQAG